MIVRLATPGDRARTLREMARARHVEAVRALESGDRDAYLRGLQDVVALDEEVRRLRRQQERLDEQRRALVVAVDLILERAHCQRAMEETREGA